MSFIQPAEAGPSRPPIQIARNQEAMEEEEECIEIPSTGVEFFEYRRRLFLAGLPIPSPPSSNSTLPPTYLIPKHPPDPLPALDRSGVTSLGVQRLEILLRQEGSEELQENWNKGIEGIAKSLHAGKKLARGLRLGLVIKILKASWIQDGLWPKDELGRPVKPPNSPLIQGVELFPEESKVRPEMAVKEGEAKGKS